MSAVPTASFAAGPPPLPSSLVGRWGLDEGSGTVAHDTSGQGNDGTISAQALWSPLGLAFGNPGAEVTVPQSPALEPAGGLTVSAWVRNTGTPGSYAYIVAKGANGCTAASWGLYSGKSGGASFYVATGHGSTYMLSPQLGADQIWDGQWHQLTGTYDGQTIRLYLDGVEVGSGTPYAAPLQYALTDSNTLMLGNYDPNAAGPVSGCQTHSFPGVIDDVDVFAQALDASTVASLYAASVTDCAGAPGSETPNYASLDGCGFPSPDTTGVPAGTTLTPVASASLPTGASWNATYNEFDIYGNNVTVSGLSIPGSVKITGNGDTLSDSYIDDTKNPGNAGNPTVLVYEQTGGTTTLSDDEIDCGGTAWAINNAGQLPMTLTGSYIHDDEGGVFGANNTIEDNYMIADHNPAGHIETVYIPGGTAPSVPPTLVEHNTILNSTGDTAAVFLDNHAGGATGNYNVTVTDNVMGGGGYVLYGDSNGDTSQNIVVTNNRFTRLYYPDGGGYDAEEQNDAATTFTGNVWDDTLQPVQADS
jgi:hypothetical protein